MHGWESGTQKAPAAPMTAPQTQRSPPSTFTKVGLPQLLGPAARATTAPSKTAPLQVGSGAQFWTATGGAAATVGASPKTARQHGSRSFSNQTFSEEERRASTAPSSQADRSGVVQLMQWIERELRIQGLDGSAPSLDRVRIYSSAFSEVIDMLPSYRPLLLAVQKEYDALIAVLRAEITAIAPLEGRVKMLKAESLSFVGESMTWFQTEITGLRQRVQIAEAKTAALLAENVKLEREKGKLTEAAAQDKLLASESHSQNLDILKHLERMEQQVERLRKSEKDVHLINKQQEKTIMDKEMRIQIMDQQLSNERSRAVNMVPREDHDAVRDELRQAQIKTLEMEEACAAKNRDYLSIVETYSKSIGQTLAESDQIRPLTPRPTWSNCKGLLDTEGTHSIDKAEVSQELMQQVVANSRTLLSAYGLAAACKKSMVWKTHSRSAHLPAPLIGATAFDVEPSGDSPSSPSRPRTGGSLAAGEDESVDGAASEKAGSTRGAAYGSSAVDLSSDGNWLLPESDTSVIESFRHTEKVKNLRLSRKKAAGILDAVLQHRHRHSSEQLTRPFAESLSEYLTETGYKGEDMKEEDVQELLINIYAAVRRYSGEPDFLAYLLLLEQKVSDTVVRDNKTLCAELLRIFTSHFAEGENRGTGQSELSGRATTRKNFYYGLREVLPHKDKIMWQEVVSYFPSGGPETLLNYEWLLLDDMYVLSPIVFTLRLQHLEECLTLMSRLENIAGECIKTAPDGVSTVRYDAVEKRVKEENDNVDLWNLLQEEGLVQAFGSQSLRPEAEQDPESFMHSLRHSDVFHTLYFPVLPSDDPDVAETRRQE